MNWRVWDRVGCRNKVVTGPLGQEKGVGEKRVWEDDKPSSGHAGREVGMRQRNAVWEVS